MCKKNVKAEEINDIILLKFDGESREYFIEYLLIQLNQQIMVMLFIILKNFSFLLRNFLFIT
jgi:hypothetical protein